MEGERFDREVETRCQQANFTIFNNKRKTSEDYGRSQETSAKDFSSSNLLSLSEISLPEKTCHMWDKILEKGCWCYQNIQNVK